MIYPFLIEPEDPERLKSWSNQLIAQLDRDREEHRNRFNLIQKPAIDTNAVTIDLINGDIVWITLDQDLTTWDVIVPRATDRLGFSWRLLLEQDGAGSHSVTFPGAWLWPGGTAPTVTATANALDVFDLLLLEDVHHGRIYGQDMS